MAQFAPPQKKIINKEHFTPFWLGLTLYNFEGSKTDNGSKVRKEIGKKNYMDIDYCVSKK